MLTLEIKTNLPQLSKSLEDIVRKQLPFALAQGVNKVAARVQEAEKANIRTTFKNPTPFTQNSVGLWKARKASPVATIFIKDIAASYLEPYEVGGVHKLNSRALLNPKDIRLNKYGQLPQGTIAKLKALPGVFIGPVTLKSGETINGIWQRPFLRGNDAQLGKNMTPRQRNKMLRNKHPNLPAGANTTGKLKLLVRFGDALPVRQHLGFHERAAKIVADHFGSDLMQALDEAMASAK